jgi:hypothetical protein
MTTWAATSRIPHLCVMKKLIGPCKGTLRRDEDSDQNNDLRQASWLWRLALDRSIWMQSTYYSKMVSYRAICDQ